MQVCSGEKRKVNSKIEYMRMNERNTAVTVKLQGAKEKKKERKKRKFCLKTALKPKFTEVWQIHRKCLKQLTWNIPWGGGECYTPKRTTAV